MADLADLLSSVINTKNMYLSYFIETFFLISILHSNWPAYIGQKSPHTTHKLRRNSVHQ